WGFARASAISVARTASATGAIARFCSALKKPGPVAYSRTSSLSRSRYTRVEPALSVAIRGACRARTPISPAAPGTMIISASPSNAGPSGVTSETSNSFRSPSATHAGRLSLGLACILADRRVLAGLLFLFLLRRLALAGQPLSLLDCLLDRADHVERLLGQIVVLALDDLLEALDRVLGLHVLAWRT